MLPEKNVVQDDDFTEVEVTHKEEEAAAEKSANVSPPESSAEPAEKEEELEQYSTKVQKRIDKLTRKLRDSERKEQAAAHFAQNVYTENQQLRHRTQTVDAGFLSEYENRIKAQEAQAKQAYQEAFQSNDSEKMTDAQGVLSKIAVENERLRVSKTQHQNQQKQIASQQQAQAYAPQPQPRVPDPDPQAVDWAEKNEWFGDNEPMTLTAFSIHRDLIENQGVAVNSKEYYDEIDKRIRKEFPQKFNDEETVETIDSPVAQTVAPVSNASGGGRKSKRIRLSKSEVDMARRLNVPLEEYAKFVKR